MNLSLQMKDELTISEFNSLLLQSQLYLLDWEQKQFNSIVIKDNIIDIKYVISIIDGTHPILNKTYTSLSNTNNLFTRTNIIKQGKLYSKCNRCF